MNGVYNEYLGLFGVNNIGFFKQIKRKIKIRVYDKKIIKDVNREK